MYDSNLEWEILLLVDKICFKVVDISSLIQDKVQEPMKQTKPKITFTGKINPSKLKQAPKLIRKLEVGGEQTTPDGDDTINNKLSV